MNDLVINHILTSAAYSILIIVYFTVTKLLAYKYTAKTIYHGWLIIALGMILPFRLKHPEPLFTMQLGFDTSRTAEIFSAQENISALSFVGLNYAYILFVLWIMGTGIFLFVVFSRYYNFMKSVKRWRKLFDSRNQVKIYISSFVKSPIIIFFPKAEIYLPEKEYEKDEIDIIIKHELIHYRRKDGYLKLLLMFAAALHWFNPLAYLMCIETDFYCESSCDEELINGSCPDYRLKYCKLLINVKNTTNYPERISVINYFGGKKQMKNRIKQILSNKAKKTGVLILCLVIVMAYSAGVVYSAITFDQVNVRFRFDESGSDMVSFTDSRPDLEFYVEGSDIERIEITCDTEYLYAVDWTGTQDMKYSDGEPSFEKTMTFVFNEGFEDHDDIWYRWNARNLYLWACENNYSRFIGVNKIMDNDIKESEKLSIAAGGQKSSIGYIDLEGYPEKLLRDRIIIKATLRDGKVITRKIDIRIFTNEYGQTVVSAKVK